jgi:uncharacterized protein involved in exopolysaccharide biosynthesis
MRDNGGNAGALDDEREAGRTAGSTGEAQSSVPGFIEFLSVLLRYRYFVVLLPAIAFSAAVTMSLTQPRTYASHASFFPQMSENSGGFASVAMRFGLTSGGGGVHSPEFYAELLRTAQILGAAVDVEYEFSNRGVPRRGDLVEIFEAQGTSPAAQRAEAIRTLNSLLEVGTSRETGIVRLRVTTEWPDLSQAVASRLIELVGEFNLERLQSRAGAERQFTEDRLRIAQQELWAAEQRVEAFLIRNRQFANSPQLQFEHERLQREVGTRQQVYAALAHSYEQARIEEVRNIPVVTVIESPVLPVRPAARGTVIKGLLALVVGGGLAIILAFSLEFLRRSRSGATGRSSEFEALRMEFLGDLRYPWARARRLVGLER